MCLRSKMTLSPFLPPPLLLSSFQTNLQDMTYSLPFEGCGNELSQNDLSQPPKLSHREAEINPRDHVSPSVGTFMVQNQKQSLNSSLISRRALWVNSDVKLLGLSSSSSHSPSPFCLILLSCSRTRSSIIYFPHTYICSGTGRILCKMVRSNGGFMAFKRRTATIL